MKKTKKINYGNSRNNNMPDVNRDKKKKEIIICQMGIQIKRKNI